MKKRLVATAIVAVAAGLALPATAVATHPESSCNTKALFTDTPLQSTLSPLFPEQTGTHEDGPVSAVVHDNAEVVEHRLDPGYRVVHYANCRFVAKNGL